MCSLFGGVKMETDSSDVVRCSCIAEYIVLSQNSVFFLFTYVFRGQRHRGCVIKCKKIKNMRGYIFLEYFFIFLISLLSEQAKKI